MSDYKDYVIVRVGKEFPTVYEAPAHMHLEKGEAVVVETDEGEVTGTVESSVTVSKKYDYEVIQFILLCAGCYEPLKRVLYRIQYIPMKFDD